jgi:hypothetical protein
MVQAISWAAKWIFSFALTRVHHFTLPRNSPIQFTSPRPIHSNSYISTFSFSTCGFSNLSLSMRLSSTHWSLHHPSQLPSFKRAFRIASGKLRHSDSKQNQLSVEEEGSRDDSLGSTVAMKMWESVESFLFSSRFSAIPRPLHEMPCSNWKRHLVQNALNFKSELRNQLILRAMQIQPHLIFFSCVNYISYNLSCILWIESKAKKYFIVQLLKLLVVGNSCIKTFLKKTQHCTIQCSTKCALR